MDKAQSIEQFYRNKMNWMPENLQKEIGHFNVFRLDDYLGHSAKPVPYSRKDFFKISLIMGKNRVHYADRVVTIDKYALLFANPQVPYNWEPLSDKQSGFFCIFTEAFFNQFGAIREYPLFQPGGNPVCILDDIQLQAVRSVFLEMLQEIASDYVYKYDVLRNHVFSLVHQALKMQPAAVTALHSGANAAARVSSFFLELLERQFPIESPMQQVQLHTPIAFAGQLSVHVNHLNRSLKTITGKTTSQLIAERIAQEARILLKHTDWNISEIAWCLGFKEPAAFINFFRKCARQSPGAFRERA